MEETLDYIELNYYQKSKAFLYPILGFSRSELFRPVGTYLMFHHHTILTYELIVYYEHQKGDPLFENFQDNRVANHPRLRACYWTDNGTIYVFDISDFAEDIVSFLSGQYSSLSKQIKGIILKYLGDNIEPMTPRPNRQMHAVLFPDQYRELVAKSLGVPKENLTELAPIYDLDKETLNIEIYTPCGITSTSEITTPI